METSKMPIYKQQICRDYCKLAAVTADSTEQIPLPPPIPWIFSKSEHIKSITGVILSSRTFIKISLDPNHPLHMTIPRITMWTQEGPVREKLCQDIIQVDLMNLSPQLGAQGTVNPPPGWVDENGLDIYFDIQDFMQPPGYCTSVSFQFKIWDAVNPDVQDNENPGHEPGQPT